MGINICYIRTSTADQEPQLQIRDINTQFKDIIFSTYQEKLSAYKDNVKRPEFDKVLKEIRKGKVDNIYGWDLDRIYRNRKRLKGFFEFCRLHKTKIHSVNQSWLENINRNEESIQDLLYDILINVIGWIGEEESEKRSKRVKMAVISKEGKRTKSYKGNNWGRKPISKQAIKKIKKLKKDGLSIRQIADEVIIYDKNKNGKNISKSAVHKILQENP